MAIAHWRSAASCSCHGKELKIVYVTIIITIIIIIIITMIIIIIIIIIIIRNSRGLQSLGFRVHYLRHKIGTYSTIVYSKISFCRSLDKTQQTGLLKPDPLTKASSVLDKPRAQDPF